MTTSPEFTSPSSPRDTPPATQRKPLTRSASNRVVAGVCAGIADHTGVDVALVRIFAILAGVFTFGSALLAYAAAYVVMAAPDGTPSPLDRWQAKRRR